MKDWKDDDRWTMTKIVLFGIVVIPIVAFIAIPIYRHWAKIVLEYWGLM